MPVGIGIATAGFIFGWMGFGDFLFNLSPARIYGVVTKYEFLAIPLFVYMGVMLEKSRVAEDMLDVIGRLSGGLHGGMALALILVGVLMGASTGIVGATVVTLTLLTMPILLKRGYDPGVAAGTICASGTLGQIIPPLPGADPARRHHGGECRHAVRRLSVTRPACSPGSIAPISWAWAGSDPACCRRSRRMSARTSPAWPCSWPPSKRWHHRCCSSAASWDRSSAVSQHRPKRLASAPSSPSSWPLSMAG